MKVRVDWDTTDDEHPNGQDAGLPEVVNIPNDILPSDIADWLSDNYGWCVNSITNIESGETKHQCKREELIWDVTPNFEGECIIFRGKCPTCAKVYEQVFTENDGLWDIEKKEYVDI